VQQPRLQSQQRDFGRLHTKNLGQDQTQVQCRHTLAQHRSQGEEMLRKYNFFRHPKILVLGHSCTVSVLVDQPRLYRTLSATRYFPK